MKSKPAPKNQRSKPVLAIDIDDVLAPHYYLLTDFLNKRYEANINPEVIQKLQGLNTITKHGPSREQVIESVHQFISSDEFYGEPLPGAVAAVERLKKSYQLVVITARPTLIKKGTELWLRAHFPETFKDIRFVGAPSWGKGRQADKAPILRDLKVNILIDDSLSHCQTASQLGIRAFLFGNYPWNENAELPHGVEVVKDWVAVERMLL